MRLPYRAPILVATQYRITLCVFIIVYIKLIVFLFLSTHPPPLAQFFADWATLRSIWVMEQNEEAAQRYTLEAGVKGN